MEEITMAKDKKDNDLVVKSNKLVNGCYLEEMNITQMKIMNLIISKVDNTKQIENITDEDLTFIFSFSELEQKLNEVELHRGERLRNYCQDLSKKQYIEIDKKDFLFIPIFSLVSYKKGVFKAIINKQVIIHLLELKKDFTKYYFDNISRFKSKYSILFYELLKANQFKNEITFTLEELILKLQITKKSMKVYSTIKRDVIEKVKDEINSTSDIHFEYSEIKKPGTKIVESLTFRIYKNENNQNIYRDKRDFINFIRKNYVNQLIVKINSKSKNRVEEITINYNGFLGYVNIFNERIDKEKAAKIWDWLFENQNRIEKYTPSLLENIA